MASDRLTMVRRTEHFEPYAFPDFQVRLLSPSDHQILGNLMYAAYNGTIDYEGESLEETIAEAAATLSGKYGEVNFLASFVVVENKNIQGEELAVSATVVTNYIKTGPLLAYSVTHPNFQNRGLAAKLIRSSLSSLFKQNIPELRLVVTAGNEPAFYLYEKLGFRKE